MKMVFCHQCMRKRPLDEEVCPACGYVHGVANVIGYILPPELILDGRYLLGNMQKQNSECIYYSALDLQSEDVITIVEYFPCEKTSRVGTTVIWSAPVEVVQNLLVGFQERNKNTEIFLENGTIYSVHKIHFEAGATGESQNDIPLAISGEKSVVEVPDNLVGSLSAVHTPQKPTAEKTKHRTGAKKRTRHSKGGKALVAIAVILLLVLGWCGVNHLRGNQAMEQEDYVEAISAYRADFLFSRESYADALRSAGEECFENKEYVMAAEYFSQLGSGGEARWSDSIYEYAQLLIREQKYEDAIVELEKIASEKRAAEQKGVAQLEIAKELYRSGKTQEAIELANRIENSTYADVTAFLNNIYLNEAALCISRDEYQAAADAYKNCKGNAEAAFNLSILEDLFGGEPYRAATAIMEQQDSKVSNISRKEWLHIFENVLTTLPSEENLNEYLNQEAAIALLEEPVDFFSESCSQNFAAIFDGNDMIGRSAIPSDNNITLDSLEELYSLCGANPSGKILITVQTHDYPDKNPSQMISFGAMDLLPAENRPASLSEVEYVVFVDYNYTITGSYTKGTKAVRETAKITIYHMPDKKSVATSGTLNGSGAPSSFYYYGTPPAWKSGGAPNISAKLVELLKKIV